MASRWACRTSFMTRRTGRRRGANRRRSASRSAGCAGCANVLPLAEGLDGVRLVAVMDREADSCALFAEQRRLGCGGILVRAMHNRSMGPDAPRLFEQIRVQPEQAHLEILVARSSARRGTRRRKQRPLRAEREAQVALRWMAVELPVPKDSSLRGHRPVHLNAVHVREQGTPQDGEPIEWMLLTSLPLASACEATRIVEQHRLRWRIEDWHRILKSGCKVEFLGHRTGERIERAVTINAVIA